jgi:hypothetical protein
MAKECIFAQLGESVAEVVEVLFRGTFRADQSGMANQPDQIADIQLYLNVQDIITSDGAK